MYTTKWINPKYISVSVKKSQTQKPDYSTSGIVYKGKTTVEMENKPAVARCMVDVDYKGAAPGNGRSGEGLRRQNSFVS